MTLRVHTAALIVGAMFPAVSIAEEPSVTRAQSATGVDWTGFSVGLEIGYTPDVDGSSGAVYGAKLAWDYDFGDYLVGYILQHTRSGFDVDPGYDFYYTRIGARGGIDRGLSMFYASAGYAVLDTHARGDINPGEGTGYFVGLGYERFVRDSVTLGAEVSYSDFSGFSRELDDLDITTLSFSLNYRF